METIYLKLEKENGVTIEVYPFTEEEIFKFFDLDSDITITSAYIRIYGNDETSVDSVTWFTEKTLFNFKTLKQLSELCKLPLDRDVNELGIIFHKYSCSTFIDDVGRTTFHMEKDYTDMLQKICQLLYPGYSKNLYSLVICNEGKYVCINPENKKHKIFNDLRDIIENESLLE
jgi:hypothetical protein